MDKVPLQVLFVTRVMVKARQGTKVADQQLISLAPLKVPAKLVYSFPILGLAPLMPEPGSRSSERVTINPHE